MSQPAFTPICPVCHRLTHRRGRFLTCHDCYAAARPSKAHAAVSKAVSSGRLPRASTLYCVDCGAFAYDYDHRDYDRPLDVVPVCRRCNLMRGPAKQLAPGFRVTA